MKQTIAIIGATGRMGAAIAKSLAGKNYRLVLFARNEEKRKRLEADIRTQIPSAEIDSTGCPYDASWEAEIIIPAVPYAAQKEVALNIKEVATQKIVVSISNPAEDAVDWPEKSVAEELQDLLPAAKVVKAFNTNRVDSFCCSDGGSNRTDCFVAGDDIEAVETIMQLVTDAGFDAVKAGGLAASRELERTWLQPKKAGLR